MAETMKKETVTVAEQVEARVNRFYLKKSRKYLAAGIVVMLMLLLYIIGVTLFFGEYVTYDNLKFLVKDFDAMNVTGTTVETKIVYNGSDSMTFKSFRGGLAVCDSDKYSYYDTSGVLLSEQSLEYSKPIMAPSEKYMLVYDLGGTSFSIFNQLTQIISRSTEREIISACISNDGEFAIASKSNETRYVVDYYSGSFNKIMSIYKDNYVTCLAISPDGNTLCICEACPGESNFNCEIEIVRRGKSEPVQILTFDNSMPFSAFSTADGFVVVTSSEVIFITPEGDIVSTVKFDGMSLKYADFNEESIAVSGSSNALGTENRVIVMNTGNAFGTIAFDEVIPTRIRGIYASKNLSSSVAYIKLPNGAARILGDGSLEKDETLTGEIMTLVTVKNGALICQKTSANLAFDK